MHEYPISGDPYEVHQVFLKDLQEAHEKKASLESELEVSQNREVVQEILDRHNEELDYLLKFAQ